MKKIVSLLKRELFIGRMLFVLFSLLMLLIVNFLNKKLDIDYLQKLFSHIFILSSFVFMLTYINKNILITIRNDFGFAEKASNIISCVVPFFFWRSFSEWFILVLNNFNLISQNIIFENIFWIPAILSALLFYSSKEDLNNGLKEYTKYLETLTEFETIGWQKLECEEFFFNEVIKIEEFDRSVQEEWKKFYSQIVINQIKNISLTRELIENIKQLQFSDYKIEEKFIKEEVTKIESVSVSGSNALNKIFISPYGFNEAVYEDVRRVYQDLKLIKISNALKNELEKVIKSKRYDKLFIFCKSILIDFDFYPIIDFENIKLKH